MTYIFVRWLHKFADEPILLFSELDADRYETRKVEIFRGGSIGLAEKNHERGGSRLGDLPVPCIEEIADSAEFFPQEITCDEFDSIWQVALQVTNAPK